MKTYIEIIAKVEEKDKDTLAFEIHSEGCADLMTRCKMLKEIAESMKLDSDDLKDVMFMMSEAEEREESKQ